MLVLELLFYMFVMAVFVTVVTYSLAPVALLQECELKRKEFATKAVNIMLLTAGLVALYASISSETKNAYIALFSAIL